MHPVPPRAPPSQPRASSDPERLAQLVDLHVPAVAVVLDAEAGRGRALSATTGTPRPASRGRSSSASFVATTAGCPRRRSVRAA
jgi:hypothetical protein